MDFRISTLVKPTIYKPKATFERLKQPKQVFQPTQPFQEREFRGLLNADYREAIMNIDTVYENFAQELDCMSTA
jgi:hypothetical protein